MDDIVELKDWFLVEFDDSGMDVISVELFDAFNPLHQGKIKVDFETLKLSVPDYKDFLKLNNYDFWRLMDIDYTI